MVVHFPTMEWPLLAGLSDLERSDVLAAARRRRFARNEVVCHAGDPADSIHLVVSGHLSVRVTLASGDTALINILGPGGYFGELALLRADRHRTATVTALEPAETLVLGASAFRALCARHPEVERSMTMLLADRVEELSQRLLESMYVGLDRRLYRRLVDLVDKYAGDDGEADGGPVTIPFTQSQLADLAGGTRPSVNQVLQRLVDQGIVSVGRGRVEVLDRSRLAVKAGG